MSDSPMPCTSKALVALGAAWRGDWHDCDGRTIRRQLEDVDAIMLVEFHTPALAPRMLEAFALNHGLCVECGSWTEHCTCAERAEA